MCNIVEANVDTTPFRGDKIEQIADNLKKIGAGVVLLTGGEPLLRQDIDEIVHAFKERKLDVRLQTAGIPSKWGLMSKCVEYGARDINVSLDSLDEDLADYINGAKGSWRAAIETISYISKVFPANDSICALGCVLSRYNKDEVEAILDFATEIGWWLSLVPVHITRPGLPMHFRGYDQYFKFGPEDFPKIKTLIERLKQKKKQGYLLFDSNDYLDSVYYFVKTRGSIWRRKGICDTPNLYFVIRPDGSFAPCCDYCLDEDIFLYDPDFPKIYRSKKFYKKVKEIARKCPGCNFGSFPEMTLSVRSLSTIKERLITQFKARAGGIKPVDELELFELIKATKQKYDVYTKKPRHPFRAQKVESGTFLTESGS